MEWKETSFADAVKATRRRANNLRTATRTATGATRIPPRRADLWSGDGEAVVVNSHPRPIDQSRLHRIISNVLHAPQQFRIITHGSIVVLRLPGMSRAAEGDVCFPSGERLQRPHDCINRTGE